MSGTRPVCPPVPHPWWWAAEPLGDPDHPPSTRPRVHRDDRRTVVRCTPSTTAAGLRGLDPTAVGPADTVELDLAELPDDPAVARALAALRVRLLVRGLRVELRDPPPAVLAATGGGTDVRYRVLDAPRPGTG